MREVAEACRELARRSDDLREAVESDEWERTDELRAEQEAAFEAVRSLTGEEPVELDDRAEVARAEEAGARLKAAIVASTSRLERQRDESARVRRRTQAFRSVDTEPRFVTRRA